MNELFVRNTERNRNKYRKNNINEKKENNFLYQFDIKINSCRSSINCFFPWIFNFFWDSSRLWRMYRAMIDKTRCAGIKILRFFGIFLFFAITFVIRFSLSYFFLWFIYLVLWSPEKYIIDISNKLYNYSSIYVCVSVCV